MRKILALLLLLPTLALAAPPEVTLEKIMSDPAWIGAWPQDFAWHPDGHTVLYSRHKPGGGDDLVHLDTAGKLLATPAQSSLPEQPAYSRDGRRWVVAWDGDLYLGSDQGWRPLTRTVAVESSPQFLDSGELAYQRDGQIFVRDLEHNFEHQVADFQLEDKPEWDESYLAQQQKRLFEVLRRRQQEEVEAPHLVPPVYLGEKKTLVESSLSGDARQLLLVLTDERDPDWKDDQMPAYVTRSGYVEVETVRAKVGTGKPDNHTLFLCRPEQGKLDEVSLATLNLQDRPVRVEQLAWVGGGWVVQLFSQDHKDRWTLRVDQAGKLSVLDHYRDEAWHSWDLNDLGPVPSLGKVFYTSEASGYSQLYLEPRRQLTQGTQVVEHVMADPRGRYLYFTANPKEPGLYEVYRANLSNGRVEAMTNLGGFTEFRLSPDGSTLLLMHSKRDRPPELYLMAAEPGAQPRQLTHIVSPEFTSIDWTIPQIVQVPSTHQPRPIYSRFYPSKVAVDGPRPAVVFIHGAGYLQDVTYGWSYYFHEFMFHTLLNRLGYVVLDMDYRASAGYGRDWRTAIYRQMGTPELEDLEDGVDWLVDTQGVDRQRVGVYGGSYGGFLTLMAMFRKPQLFACGAALRPVTDWAHYNDEYTSRILNTPGGDPDSYSVSSPIEFAAGLEHPLLMCHGMLDDNVFVSDTVRLAQKLIELKKENWEMALFPMESHGFIEPTSWLDEYRRIFKLFRANLQ
ncbi:MAG: prolyl oligopeptidase family serine peptidase [Candidatus Eremiobacteraeota bacterium]|nr:prolyl oligopeptidase family serine peptidase [Candidatus Eremiobacteraeota bacterium]